MTVRDSTFDVAPVSLDGNLMTVQWRKPESIPCGENSREAHDASLVRPKEHLRYLPASQEYDKEIKGMAALASEAWGNNR